VKRALEECGCCGAYHWLDYFGDCRNDYQRFPSDICDHCGEDAELVVKTRACGFEAVCRKCARNLLKDGQVVE